MLIQPSATPGAIRSSPFMRPGSVFTAKSWPLKANIRERSIAVLNGNFKLRVGLENAWITRKQYSSEHRHQSCICHGNPPKTIISWIFGIIKVKVLILADLWWRHMQIHLKRICCSRPLHCQQCHKRRIDKWSEKCTKLFINCLHEVNGPYFLCNWI